MMQGRLVWSLTHVHIYTASNHSYLAWLPYNFHPSCTDMGHIETRYTSYVSISRHSDDFLIFWIMLKASRCNPQNSHECQ